MGDVRLDWIFLKLYLLFSDLYFIFINHLLASLYLGCFFACLKRSNNWQNRDTEYHKRDE